jgi:phenylacetic acid degradation operon negative regulatory protein
VASNPFQRQLKSILDGFRKEPPSRTPSLVATLFGDVVESHDREIWLGSITALLEPLGVNERLVRTAVYRLAKDDFVESSKIGRRSYYRLTESARKKVSGYDELIYYPSNKQWNGDWILVFTGTQGINAKQRARLRKELTWLGYGIIAPNAYGHPTAPITQTQAILAQSPTRWWCCGRAIMTPCTGSAPKAWCVSVSSWASWRSSTALSSSITGHWPRRCSMPGMWSRRIRSTASCCASC